MHHHCVSTRVCARCGVGDGLQENLPWPSNEFCFGAGHTARVGLIKVGLRGSRSVCRTTVPRPFSFRSATDEASPSPAPAERPQTAKLPTVSRTEARTDARRPPACHVGRAALLCSARPHTGRAAPLTQPPAPPRTRVPVPCSHGCLGCRRDTRRRRDMRRLRLRASARGPAVPASSRRRSMRTRRQDRAGSSPGNRNRIESACAVGRERICVASRAVSA